MAQRQRPLTPRHVFQEIPDRKLVVEESKAKSVSETALEKVRDAHVRMSLEPQQAWAET